MKNVTIILVFFLLALTSLAVAEKAVRIPFQPMPDEVQYVPNEFVVKLKPDVKAFTIVRENGVQVTGIRAFDVLNQRFGVDRMEAQFPGAKAEPGVPDLSRHYVLRFGAPVAMERVLNAYAQNPFVENVEPIGIHPVVGVPDDPYFDDPPVSFPYYQWHFEQGSADHDVDAAAAWDLETGDASVILGILDSGVRYYHRDLGGYLAPDDVTQGNMWINSGEYGSGKESNGVDDDDNGYVDDWIGWDWVDGVSRCHKTEDCSTPDNDPRDHNGHGTHVAGIVGAITNNTYCGAGMAGGWNASRYQTSNGVKLMALRIGWSDRGGNGWVRMDFAAQAMYYAANMGATAVNCSWGSSNSGGLAAAVDYAISKGVLIVAAAGNANSETFDYLGGRTDVMDVAATDSFDVRASFSNYGTWVEVSAPGVDVLSTFHSYDDPANDYIAMISGTSQACPHVVGLAALLKSYEPSLSSSDIWSYIVDYADSIDHLNPGYEGKLGSGRINAYASVSAVGEPPPPDTIPPADVTDLSGSTGSSNGTVDLTWTAPGDDGNTGTATTYDVRYQLTTLGPLDSEGEWSSASQATGEPAPQSAGLTENFTVSGLTPGTAYYFALKTADEVPNWSGLSNTDFATAAEIPDQPMFAESIAMRLRTAGVNVTAYAKPKVVEDATGYPALEGVTIYGHWYGATSDVDQCITGPDGTCEVASDKVKSPSQDFCFQVDSLKKTSFYWDDTKGVIYNCISPGAGKHAGLVSVFSAQNYPNPFNLETQFSLTLPVDSKVKFVIYNITGQKVKTLVNENMSAGTHTINWDGTNENGNVVSSGIYFYKVVAGDIVTTKKMILMK